MRNLLVLMIVALAGCFPLNTHYRNYGEPWSQMTILQTALFWTILIVLGIGLGLFFRSDDS